MATVSLELFYARNCNHPQMKDCILKIIILRSLVPLQIHKTYHYRILFNLYLLVNLTKLTDSYDNLK